MQVASKELSKKLYEVSKWIELGQNGLSLVKDGSPVYSLGYILRKLQTLCDRGSSLRGVTVGVMHKEWGNWSAYYETKYDRHKEHWIEGSAETPVDAAVSLAIALFENGILKWAIPTIHLETSKRYVRETKRGTDE